MKQKKTRRMTVQAEATLEELRKLKTHPTAEELHNILRKRLPKVSLGTVYRNLKMMVREGEALRLVQPDGEARFDGYVDVHYHIRCRSCGRLDDVEMKPLTRIEPRLQEQSGWLVEGHSLEFEGICPRCLSMGGVC